MENTRLVKSYRVTAVLSKREVSLRIFNTESGVEVDGPFMNCGDDTFENLAHVMQREDKVRWHAIDEQGERIILDVTVPQDGRISMLIFYKGEWIEEFWTCDLSQVQRYDSQSIKERTE